MPTSEFVCAVCCRRSASAASPLACDLRKLRAFTGDASIALRDDVRTGRCSVRCPALIWLLLLRSDTKGDSDAELMLCIDELTGKRDSRRSS